MSKAEETRGTPEDAVPGEDEATPAPEGAVPDQDEASDPSEESEQPPPELTRLERWKRALYSDGRRGLITMLAPFPVALAVGLPNYPANPTEPGVLLLFSLSVALVATVAVVVVMALLTLWVFGRLRGDELAAAVSRDARHGQGRLLARVERSRWMSVLVTGGSAPTWSIQLSLLSLVFAVMLAVRSDLQQNAAILITVVIALVANALSVWVAYGLHYARLDLGEGGLRWPGEPQPRAFVDYLYLSAVAQIAYSAADVAVTTSRLRRVVMGHAAIGFVFNAVVIVILVSVLIGIGQR